MESEGKIIHILKQVGKMWKHLTGCLGSLPHSWHKKSSAFNFKERLNKIKRVISYTEGKTFRKDTNIPCRNNPKQ